MRVQIPPGQQGPLIYDHDFGLIFLMRLKERQSGIACQVNQKNLARIIVNQWSIIEVLQLAEGLPWKQEGASSTLAFYTDGDLSIGLLWRVDLKDFEMTEQSEQSFQSD